LLLSASNASVPDIVAVAATAPNNDGIVAIPGEAGTGFFAVASINLGAGETLGISADTGSASLPVDLSRV
jgi:predicted RNA methylase